MNLALQSLQNTETAHREVGLGHIFILNCRVSAIISYPFLAETLELRMKGGSLHKLFVESINDSIMHR